MMKKHVTLALCAVALTGCFADPEPVEKIGTVENLYNDGMDELNTKEWDTAINTFEELERQHPYSGWATRAQMMVAYAEFRKGNMDETVLAAERFIRAHPGHVDLPYMFYLVGLAHYLRISDVNRDQAFTEQALLAFEELVRRYPDSEYAQDAKLKITLCHDHLAGKEMMVGRYYQSQGRHLAALNRFKEVIQKYERTAQTPEALYRLTEAYLSIGLPEEAQKSASVLGHNFNNSDWYEKAYGLLVERNLADAGAQESFLKKIF